MLEQRRLDYLQAMGVVQWMPRQPLPFAPAPRWLPEANAKKVEQAVPVTGFNKQETKAQLASVRPSFNAAHSAPVVAAPIVEAVASSVANNSAHSASSVAVNAPVIDANSDQQVPRFHLYFVQSLLPVTWVCDRVEDVELVQQLAFKTQKALLGESMFVAAPAEFRWPFIMGAAEAEQTTPVALQALRAHWQFIQEQGSRGIISVGPDSQKWLSQVSAPSHFHIPVLAEFLANASLKRQLWLTLLHLLRG